jgi:hypothetical protein
MENAVDPLFSDDASNQFPIGHIPVYEVNFIRYSFMKQKGLFLQVPNNSGNICTIIVTRLSEIAAYKSIDSGNKNVPVVPVTIVSHIKLPI